MGAFSFFPSKTLSGIGDGGCIVTDNFSQYKKILKLRNHGQGKNYEHEFVGANSRLDSLNAFVLNEKLSIFQDIKKSRNSFYDFYINFSEGIFLSSFKATRLIAINSSFKNRYSTPMSSSFSLGHKSFARSG